MKEIVPSNSRYVPLTQQKSCCVPTCISMVMLRHGMKLVPQELLGYELGLVVSDKNKKLYWNPRTGERPQAGFGTQISKFPPQKAFKKLDIPLDLNVNKFENFKSSEEILVYLQKVEEKDKDVLVSLESGFLNGEDFIAGHILVFDRVVNGEIRLIDPSAIRPKWRLFTPEKIFKAMELHPKKDSAGFWELEAIK